jgi:hypothetical protein
MKSEDMIVIRDLAEQFRPKKDSLVIRSMLLSSVPGLVCGMSTSLGGVSPAPLGMNLSSRVGDSDSNVTRNLELFAGELGISASRMAFSGQVHGSDVLRVSVPGKYTSCDALVTDVQDLFLAITVADCVPIILVHPGRKVVSTVHAGWRGTLDGVAAATVGRMVRDYGSDPDEILAWIGPSARPCCYRVGPEVAGKFRGEFVRKSEKEFFLDLLNANAVQLKAAGIPTRQIEASSYCTICNPDVFHSFRRDGERSGRMLAVAGFR